jgi:phosphatidate cytidylyltransferase
MKNLIIRTASGVLFLAIMIGAILWNIYSFWILSCVIVVVGMIEFFNMTIPKGHLIQKILSISIGLSGLSFFSPFIWINSDILAVFCLSVCFYFWVIIPVIELYKKSEKPFLNVSLMILPLFYVALPFMLMNLLYLLCNDYKYAAIGGSSCILAFFILIWTNDVGAYCFGMLLGRHGKHKFFPRISPKKSWEGFIGGIITTILAGVLISKLMFDGENMHHWIIIAIITSVLGTFGDLVESMLKRSANVKDSGKIIPGHGGILDRFDAALLSFPVVFVYILSFIL